MPITKIKQLTGKEIPSTLTITLTKYQTHSLTQGRKLLLRS